MRKKKERKTYSKHKREKKKRKKKIHKGENICVIKNIKFSKNSSIKRKKMIKGIIDKQLIEKSLL